MVNALILTENQTHFLQENRQDPITGDSFSLGDEIVFCAECKSAFFSLFIVVVLLILHIIQALTLLTTQFSFFDKLLRIKLMQKRDEK